MRSRWHRFVNWLEGQLFRLLHMPPEPQLVWNGTVRDAKGWQTEHRAWWLALPWYGHVADRLMLSLRRVGSTQGVSRQTLQQAQNRIDLLRASRALARAQTLIYTSSYIHDPNGEMEIEGYFDFGRLSYGLTIRSLESFAVQARYEWESGTVDQLFTYPFGEDVVVPTRTIKPDQVPEILRRWYVNRFDWKWGHWTHRQGLQPDFEVRLEWSRPASLWTKLKKLARNLAKLARSGA